MWAPKDELIFILVLLRGHSPAGNIGKSTLKGYSLKVVICPAKEVMQMLV